MSRRKTIALACTSGALLLCAALLALAHGAADAPSTSDTAVIESYVRLASEGRLFVGAYSRYQWHHPGPLYFYLLAPLYRLGGSSTAALNAGAAILSLGWLGLIAWMTARRRTTLALPVCGALAVFAWRAAEGIASPWNPHVPVLPIVALLVASADVVAGAAGMLPVVAFLASLTGQAHVALMPVSLVLGAAAALRALIGAVNGQATGSWRRAVGATAIVLAVCWALPVYEQFTARPRGNVTELTQFFLHHAASGQPLGIAVSAWSDMLVGVLRPDFYVAHGWPFVESPVRWAEATALLLLGLLVLSCVRAARERDHFTLALSVELMVAALVGLWSVTRIDEKVFDHDVFWLAGVGTLMLAVALDTGRRLVWRRTVGAGAGVVAMRVCFAVAASVAILSATTQVRRAVSASRAPSEDATMVRALADDLQRVLASNDWRRPSITIDQDAWGVVAGAILDLQKRGQEVAVPDDWVVMFTPVFAKNGAEDITIHVAMADTHARLGARGLPVISSHGPLWAHAESIRGGPPRLRQAP